jgi:hypothetical protein
MSEEKTYPECEFALVKDITNVNYKPHPFTVGPEHVEYAVKHNFGHLDESVARAVPCAARIRGKRCNFSYDDHISDRLALVQLKRNCESSEMQTWLQSLISWATSVHIDGFTFVDTPQHYRILNLEEANRKF